MSRDVSKISQIILGYYNSKYNKNEKREETFVKKSQQTLTKPQRNLTNYNKLITQPDDSNNKKDRLNKINMKKLMTIKENETKEQNRKTDIKTKDIKTKDIKNIIKINNNDLLKKIVYYRLLVIKKKISILKLILLTYVGTIIQLCVDDLDASTKVELEEIKTQIKKFINNYIITKDTQMDKAINELSSFLKFYTNNL
jgi:hypothetical protein